ncbi:J domain-containing protein [Sphingoaurantiacus capsulatus]|uniref:J domain-containing protein n=1 Tax=Sphingoaurantiacus capsulatus TaxID=1771310 RepID=A0ABV7X993_9SPHN
MTEPRFKRGSRFHGRVEHDEPTPCGAPGCKEAGEFRAPSRDGAPGDGPRAWRWFCLDHVREFNAGYNFFQGMTADEIAAAQSPHPSWERKTRGFASNAYARGDVQDPLDILSGRYGAGSFARATAKNGRVLRAKDREALSVLRLDDEASLADIRRRYTELVRRYHPDANGGDRTHERQLQDVIDAYTHLKSAPAFA